MRLSLGLRVSIGGVGKEGRNANKHPKVDSFESMMDGNLVHLQALLCLDYKTPQHHIACKAFPFVKVILLQMIRPIPFRVRLVKPSRTICTAHDFCGHREHALCVSLLHSDEDTIACFKPLYLFNRFGHWMLSPEHMLTHWCSSQGPNGKRVPSGALAPSSLVLNSFFRSRFSCARLSSGALSPLRIRTKRWKRSSGITWQFFDGMLATYAVKDSYIVPSVQTTGASGMNAVCAPSSAAGNVPLMQSAFSLLCSSPLPLLSLLLHWRR